MSADDLQANRVRVARVIARMNVGGPAQQIARLMEGLDPNRYDHRLYCGDVAGDEADFIALRAPDLPHTKISGMRRSVGVLSEASSFTALVAEFRRFRPHIVHTHTAKAGVLGRLAAKAAGVPVLVHTFHGHLLNSYWDERITKAVVATERKLAEQTDLIMAVGTRVRDDLLAAGIGQAAQFRVMPPGVSITQPLPRAEARTKFDVPAAALTLAFVGRLATVKRPDRLLDAIRIIKESRGDVHVLVAGEGPEYASTRAAASDLGAAVRFLGWQADVQNVYAAADIVVLTSDNEGMPVGLIEASLCGRPSVTTNAGSASEVVLDGVTGHVVARDANAVAQAVLELAADPAMRTRMGVAAARHALEQFGAARLVRDTDDSYRDLLQARGLLRTRAVSNPADRSSKS